MRLKIGVETWGIISSFLWNKAGIFRQKKFEIMILVESIKWMDGWLDQTDRQALIEMDSEPTVN